MEALPSTIFQEIRQEFLAETEEMLEALEEQLRLVRSEDPRTRSVALNRIYRRMHSLKGSAGMFGFPRREFFEIADVRERAVPNASV